MSGSSERPAPGAGQQSPRGTHALFCVGNADERFTTLALENLLVELASKGNSPLAVFTDSPPFSMQQSRAAARDRLDKHFEHYTAAAIPAIRLSNLCACLSDARQKKLFLAEGSRYGTVLIRGSSIPETGLPTPADEVVLFVVNGPSTPGWVYQAARTLAGRDINTPIAVVVMNAGHLEEAAVFFQDTKDEVVSLLKKEVPIRFAGYMKFDPDYTDAALKTGCSLVECFPTSPIHGQVKYVVNALLKAVDSNPNDSYFARLAVWLESRRAHPHN